MLTWKHWILGALFALALSVDGWGAETGNTHTTIELGWRHLARTDDDMRALQGAVLPNNGYITWVLWRSGLETLSIRLANGFFCTTSDTKMIGLTCGSDSGYWAASKAHGEATVIEWVAPVLATVKGEKS